MICPYCQHPLEPLIIRERHSGAYQCVHCIGSWIRFEQVTYLTNTAETGTEKLLPLSQELISTSGESPNLEKASSSFHTPTYAFSSSLEKEANSESMRHSRWWPWSKRSNKNDDEKRSSDWNVCTYCGKSDPGNNSTCIHCNVERMRCPECRELMIGVRREGVLVDLCLRCKGLFFEKGRLEALIEHLQGVRTGEPSSTTVRPSLLQQLASFLEDTDPSPYSVEGASNLGVLHTVASAFGEGLGGGRRVLYDFLTFLGDLGTQPNPPNSKSIEVPKPWSPDS